MPIIVGIQKKSQKTFDKQAIEGIQEFQEKNKCQV